jgi:hypothetical protein
VNRSRVSHYLNCTTAAGMLLASAAPAWGQGCVAARQGTAVIGALCSYTPRSGDAGPRAIGPPPFDALQRAVKESFQRSPRLRG